MIEIEKELELGLENSHSLSDDPERKCELESRRVIFSSCADVLYLALADVLYLALECH